METSSSEQTLELPPRRAEGTVAVEAAIAGRRSVRAFVDRPIPLVDVSSLLWAAQGMTSADGLRAAPSAGALHPLTLYLIADRVEDLAPGVWRYVPERHALQLHRPGDYRGGLAHAAMRQHWMGDSAVLLVFAATLGRVVHKYGSRGQRYVHLEVGCAAENAWLQARALGLDAAMVGAFVDGDVGSLVGLAADEKPILLLSVGHRAEEVAVEPWVEV